MSKANPRAPHAMVTPLSNGVLRFRSIFIVFYRPDLKWRRH